MSEDDEPEFEHVTTQAVVDTYIASTPIFAGLLREIRDLSKKKPDATMSAGKVKIVNRVLSDLLSFLKDEPTGKYLEPLDDEALPQLSDAVLVMVQFETALDAFERRYNRYVYGKHYWITSELLAAWESSEDEDEEDNTDDHDGNANGGDQESK